ncbi:hypothetical protein [Curtobacterium sp. Leaf261]|uniref:hypothetical protein n=1 Tax=Curtobacterium sp. Leaf261 TaxID=1736311 RepID=UPI000AA0B687|nr:hypothetical protein [Curtobacterium sp. Leaf261]
MSKPDQTEPVMDGATDATNHEKLHGLIEQVEHDHGHEGAASMADHLRDRMDETGVEDEGPAETED